MRFHDYVSSFDVVRRAVATQGDRRLLMNHLHVDVTDFESVYSNEIKKHVTTCPPITPSTLRESSTALRLRAERQWYRDRRPFFNVYPAIERKFFELSDEIDMSTLVMPYPTIEVRTQWTVFLLCETIGDNFLFVFFDRSNSGVLRNMIVERNEKIRSHLSKGPWTDFYSITSEQMMNCLFLAAGMCMLARDPNIIMPVILNKHRKDGMTPAEIAKYADKAIKRTGRVGFEVGRDIERMKATVHYRNGCFAKYYVSKTHESYPANAVASTVPIIKWRCGSVVNKGNVPRVPTGFKDADLEEVK